MQQQDVIMQEKLGHHETDNQYRGTLKKALANSITISKTNGQSRTEAVVKLTNKLNQV
jgi:hypothetical protein